MHGDELAGCEGTTAGVGLFDGDGEAVVVGAALGLDGHVAGGVTAGGGRTLTGRLACTAGAASNVFHSTSDSEVKHLINLGLWAFSGVISKSNPQASPGACYHVIGHEGQQDLELVGVDTDVGLEGVA